MDKPLAPVWTESFKVHSYEVGAHQRATLPALCRFFQEAAWNHAERLGVGYTRLQEEKRLWVLSRFLIRIDRYPRWTETVTVRTWPRHARSVFALRDFQIADAAGERLAAGSSAWLVLDSASRKPLRADKVLAHFTELSQETALDREAEKLPPLENAGNQRSQPVQAHYSDLDVNGHVNYIWYISCALDSCPVQFHAEHEPHWVEVNYLGETAGDETVSVETFQTGANESLHSIAKLEPREEVCRLRIQWRPAAGR